MRSTVGLTLYLVVEADSQLWQMKVSQLLLLICLVGVPGLALVISGHQLNLLAPFQPADGWQE